jgi:hypothetical protein
VHCVYPFKRHNAHFLRSPNGENMRNSTSSLIHKGVLVGEAKKKESPIFSVRAFSLMREKGELVGGSGWYMSKIECSLIQRPNSRKVKAMDLFWSARLGFNSRSGRGIFELPMVIQNCLKIISN